MKLLKLVWNIIREINKAMDECDTRTDKETSEWGVAYRLTHRGRIVSFTWYYVEHPENIERRMKWIKDEMEIRSIE